MSTWDKLGFLRINLETLDIIRYLGQISNNNSDNTRYVRISRDILEDILFG